MCSSSIFKKPILWVAALGYFVDIYDLLLFSIIRIPSLTDLGISELADLPYIDYDLAQKIITYRKLNEGVRSFEELSKINGFPSDKIDRIKLYLTLE